MKAYDEYKATNYDWLSQIPAHWDKKTIRAITSVSDKRCGSNTDLELLSVYREYGVIKKNSRDDNHNVESEDLSNYKYVQKGNLVMNKMKMWQGSLGISEYEGIVSPAYIVCKIKSDANSRYLHTLLRSPLFKTFYNRISYGVRVGQWDMRYDDFKSLNIFLPPRSEQDQIVRFLDHKVSMINDYIKAKKKQIELLKEQKQAIINQAVTKYSHGWEEKPLKYWVKSNLLSLSSNMSPDYKMDYLDISSIGHGFVKQKPVHYTFADAPSRARRIVKYGDTIISNVRTYLRSVCFINQEIEHCIVSTGFSVLTPNKNMVLPELLSFALTTDQFVDEVIRNSVGVSYPAINDSKLMSLNIALPKTLEEQQCLYTSVKEQFSTFDAVLQNLQKEISLIQEYRTRLISDVVTGKMDVRGVKVPEGANMEAKGVIESAENDVEIDSEGEL
ncbi:MAG: restriction endonuclease subunit S [Termitinemataceae bacterium]|nr:MAG: restriction endonuclease subunit S [Termitinemataceae bacterium]